MQENERHQAEAGASGGSLPGRLSALLHDLAHVPEAEVGAGWDPVLEPGTVIGRFELLREVGRGGFGEVWKCEAPGGILKAVKIIPADSDLLSRSDGPACAPSCWRPCANTGAARNRRRIFSQARTAVEKGCVSHPGACFTSVEQLRKRPESTGKPSTGS